MKTKNLSPLSVQASLAEKNIKICTHDEFRRIFGISASQAKYFLESYTKKNLFTRLKKGLYALSGNFPDEEEIANRLYQPSYISLEYALARYSIIPEMVYTLTSITTKPTRRFTVGNKAFDYQTIKKSAYTGYVLTKENGKSFLLAEPEKALVDYLYFVSLGQKKLGDRLSLAGLKKNKLINFAKLYNRPSLVTLVKKNYD